MFDGVLAANESTPPRSLDTEKILLGMILNDGDLFVDAKALLCDEAFTINPHRRVWDAMNKLSDRGDAISSASVASFLAKDDDIRLIGGLQYILALCNQPFIGKGLSSCIEVLNEKLMLRRIIERSASAAREAILGEKKASEIVDELVGNASTIETLNDTPQAETIAEIVEAMGGLDNFTKGDTGILIPTMHKAVNRMVRGFKPGQFVIVAARPSHGKTVYGLQLASHFARRQGRKTVLFTMEMSKEELITRLLSAYSGVPSDLIDSGEARRDPLARSRLAMAYGVLREIPLRIVELKNPTFPAIWSWLRKARLRGFETECVLIDYIGLMKGVGKSENRQQEISDISRSLKMQLCQEQKLLVVALAQLNRTFANRGGDEESMRPQLTDLRESGSLEQDADKVCFIHRPEMYFGDTKPELKGKAELIYRKNRQGRTGIVTLDFRGENSYFYDPKDNNDGSPVVETGGGYDGGYGQERLLEVAA